MSSVLGFAQLGEAQQQYALQQRAQEALARHQGSFEDATTDLLRGGQSDAARLVAQLGHELRTQRRETIMKDADVRAAAFEDAGRRIRNAPDRGTADRILRDTFAEYDLDASTIAGADPATLIDYAKTQAELAKEAVESVAGGRRALMGLLRPGVTKDDLMMPLQALTSFNGVPASTPGMQRLISTVEALPDGEIPDADIRRMKRLVQDTPLEPAGSLDEMLARAGSTDPRAGEPDYVLELMGQREEATRRPQPPPASAAAGAARALAAEEDTRPWVNLHQQLHPPGSAQRGGKTPEQLAAIRFKAQAVMDDPRAFASLSRGGEAGEVLAAVVEMGGDIAPLMESRSREERAELAFEQMIAVIGDRGPERRETMNIYRAARPWLSDDDRQTFDQELGYTAAPAGRTMPPPNPDANAAPSPESPGFLERIFGGGGGARPAPAPAPAPLESMFNTAPPAAGTVGPPMPGGVGSPAGMAGPPAGMPPGGPPAGMPPGGPPAGMPPVSSAPPIQPPAPPPGALESMFNTAPPAAGTVGPPMPGGVGSPAGMAGPPAGMPPGGPPAGMPPGGPPAGMPPVSSAPPIQPPAPPPGALESMFNTAPPAAGTVGPPHPAAQGPPVPENLPPGPATRVRALPPPSTDANASADTAQRWLLDVANVGADPEPKPRKMSASERRLHTRASTTVSSFGKGKSPEVVDRFVAAVKDSLQRQNIEATPTKIAELIRKVEGGRRIRTDDPEVERLVAFLSGFPDA